MKYDAIDEFYKLIGKTEQTDDIERQIENIKTFQTITIFSCRLQGKRANKAKKMIQELTEYDTCEESQNLSNERTGEKVMAICWNC